MHEFCIFSPTYVDLQSDFELDHSGFRHIQSFINYSNLEPDTEFLRFNITKSTYGQQDK